MLILVVGPESTGTRFIAGALSEHPDIRGTDGGHWDPLDGFWNRGEDPDLCGIVLTRRSLPAGTGGAARFRQWPDFEPLIMHANRQNVPIKVIVTARSPLPHLNSWVATRASVQGQMHMALKQYQEAYRIAFRLCEGREHYVLPVEAVALDGAKCIESMWKLLGLRPHESRVLTRPPNEDRYG